MDKSEQWFLEPREGGGGLLYTLGGTGRFENGVPQMRNRHMVEVRCHGSVTKDEADDIARRLLEFLNGGASEQSAQEANITECVRRAPHVLMRPAIFPDGNQWCALYGENLQEGVAGFGDTPELACANFDINWRDQTLRK